VVHEVDFVSQPASERIVYADTSQREEYARFERAAGLAEIVYITTRKYHLNNLSLDNWDPLHTMINSWNKIRGHIQFDADAFTYDADWARFLVKPFTLKENKQNCAGFNAEWDIKPDDPDLQPSKKLFGYFCETGGRTLTRKDIEKLISGIGVRGINFKLAKNIAEIPAIPKTPTQSELKARVQKGPYGTPNFPYNLARVYSVDFAAF